MDNQQTMANPKMSKLNEKNYVHINWRNSKKSVTKPIMSRKMVLRINEEETKYIKSSTQARRYLQNLTTGDFKFEGANSFTYLELV